MGVRQTTASRSTTGRRRSSIRRRCLQHAEAWRTALAGRGEQDIDAPGASKMQAGPGGVSILNWGWRCLLRTIGSRQGSQYRSANAAKSASWSLLLRGGSLAECQETQGVKRRSARAGSVRPSSTDGVRTVQQGDKPAKTDGASRGGRCPSGETSSREGLSVSFLTPKVGVKSQLV